MKTLTMVVGSPKVNGNTSKIVESILSEIDHNFIKVNKFELSNLKNVKHCTGCDSCKRNGNHNCIFDDGLNEIIHTIRKSDMTIIASPVYFFNFNSLTKAFIDRLFYSSEINNDENILKDKNFCVVLTYGLNNFMESGAKNALQSFYDISKFVGFNIFDIIEGTLAEENTQSELFLNRARELGRRINKEILA